MKCCGLCGSIVAGALAATVAMTATAWTKAQGSKPGDEGGSDAASVTGDVLGFRMNRLDGSPQDLAEYRGKVVLIVNVASRCGYTPQYEGLERLYRQKADKGFVVLGFPANNFGSQEPGTNVEIAEFCTSRFGVTFPMFEKISVMGEDRHPLYRTLAGQPAPVGGDPKWNFTKFLVDRSGKVVARYEPKVKPDDPALIARIDELLGAAP